MPVLHYLQIPSKTSKILLISYKPSLQIIHTSAQTYQQLHELIVSQSSKCNIHVLCTKEQQKQIMFQEANRLKNQTKLEVRGRFNQQENLLEQIQSQVQESQFQMLKKAHNLLEQMITKTQGKIGKSNFGWTMDKIQVDLQKYKKIKQQNQLKSLGGDKKAKKHLKAAQKKIQNLEERKKQLLQSWKNKQINAYSQIEQLKNKQSSSDSDQQLLGD